MKLYDILRVLRGTTVVTDVHGNLCGDDTIYGECEVVCLTRGMIYDYNITIDTHDGEEYDK